MSARTGQVYRYFDSAAVYVGGGTGYMTPDDARVLRDRLTKILEELDAAVPFSTSAIKTAGFRVYDKSYDLSHA